MESTQKFYRVGGHLFSVTTLIGPRLWEVTDSCRPFETHGDGSCIFRLTVEYGHASLPPGSEHVVCFKGDGTSVEMYESGDGIMTYSISSPVSGTCAVLTARHHSGDAVLTCMEGIGPGALKFAAANAMMILYAIKTACLGTLLIHASAVAYKGKAYVFLGKSGTGKSTHSRLWTGNIPGAYLLNDDNPVIVCDSSGTAVYGTPWSGKTPCYRNESLPAGGIIRLSQGNGNVIEKVSGARAYAALFPSVSAMRWKRQYADGIHSTLENIIGNTGIYLMTCRPDREAAMVCLGAMEGGQR